jgi:hypothetical protein
MEVATNFMLVTVAWLKVGFGVTGAVFVIDGLMVWEGAMFGFEKFNMPDR